MGRRRAPEELPEYDFPKFKKARTPAAREKQLVSLAYDLAEKRLREGTASSAEVVQLLKAGSKKETLEHELAETRMELMKAKKEALESAKRIEALYLDAMEQFRRYNGIFDEGVEDDGTYVC